MRVAAPAPAVGLSRGLKRYLDDECFSDVTFIVEKRKVYAHKARVERSSPNAPENIMNAHRCMSHTQL